MYEPTRIDRAILSVVPKWGRGRIRNKIMASSMVRANKIANDNPRRRGGERGFDGAAKGQSMSGWERRGTSAGPNSEIGGAINELTNSSHDLIQNDGLATNAQRIWTEGIIGDGISGEIVRVTGNKKRIEKTRKDLWERWSEDPDECDYYGLFNLAALQAQICDAWFAGGECLVIKHATTDNDTVPLRIQVLEGAYIANNFTDRDPDKGGVIVNGVKFGKDGRIQGLYLHKTHPGEGNRLSVMISARVTADQFIFIERENIIHCFSAHRPGVMRGLPRLTPTIVGMKDLGDWEYAKLKLQQITSCYAAFVTGEDDSALTTDNDKLTTDEMVDTIEPGMVTYLGLDRKVEFGKPPNGDNGNSFAKDKKHTIAAAVGCTYEDLTTDNKDVTFISGRIGRIRQNKVLNRQRKTIFIPNVMNRIFKWFDAAAIISGDTRGTCKMLWASPMPEITDPEKEGDALNNKVRRGFIGPLTAIRSTGGVPDQIVDEAVKWHKMIDDAEMILDSDPRHTSLPGQKQLFGDESVEEAAATAEATTKAAETKDSENADG